MNETWAMIGVIIGPISLAISMLVHIGTLRERKKAPDAVKEQEMKRWRGRVDEKQDNDHARLSALEKERIANEDFRRITLQCLKGMMEHFSVGNHIDAMKELSGKIDKYLIER